MNSREIIKKIIKENPGITTSQIARLSKLDLQLVFNTLVELGVNDELTFIDNGYGLSGNVSN